MMFLTLLVDLNLAVWYGIAIRTCTQKKKLAFNLVVERHTGKPPNFLAIRYMFGHALVTATYELCDLVLAISD